MDNIRNIAKDAIKAKGKKDIVKDTIIHEGILYFLFNNISLN